MMIDVLKTLGCFAVGGCAGYLIGFARAQVRMLTRAVKKSPKREDEMVIVHEGILDGDALRFTLRSRARVASFLVPREIVYQMSDDLLRAAAQLGKREQPQRGPE